MRILFIILSATLISSCSDNKISNTEVGTDAKNYVKSTLKSPSTAEFGQPKVYPISELGFFVEGHVDSQNGFGAIVRGNYGLTIHYPEGGGKPEFTDYNFR